MSPAYSSPNHMIDLSRYSYIAFYSVVDEECTDIISKEQFTKIWNVINVSWVYMKWIVFMGIANISEVIGQDRQLS